MFKEYYHSQLRSLREDAKDFAALYPSLAPMLVGQSPDPDVERLLEGVAYMTGMIQEKLDDEFPEIIHGLTDLIFPHFLRPLPSATLIEFTPKPGLKERLRINAGTQIAAKELDGTSCRFRTIAPLDLHPLTITNGGFSYTVGQAGTIKLSLELNGLSLDSWSAKEIRLYINGGYSDAADLHFLLSRYCDSIAITPEGGGESCILGPEAIRHAGFSNSEQLLPYPARSFPGYRVLQEYFLFPQKFLFLELTSLEKWVRRGKGTRFTIEFRMKQLPFTPPVIGRDTFMLHIVPAINLFAMDGEPITIDQRQQEYRLNPSSSNKGHYEIHSIDKVTGIMQGSAEQRSFAPFDQFHEQHAERPVYEVKRRPSKTERDLDVSLAVTYPDKVNRYAKETLSVSLTCSNGSLAERLGIGDICIPTSTSPELATFRNIVTPSPSMQPPLGSNKLWQLLSHLSLNFLSVATLENTKEILSIYVFPEERDKSRVAANSRKVEGIVGMKTKASERLVRGYMMRGTDITLSLRQDHFSSIGNMVMFGSVLDYFFGVYSSINAYTRLTIEETITGSTYTWKPRLGERFLL